MRKIELTSSCEQGGRFELAAILNGRKKHATNTSSCSKYSSSASTMLNTRLFRFRMLSACGDLMYISTICFQRRRHNQPRKKLCTFFIFCSSTVSLTDSQSFDSMGSSATSQPALKLPRPTGVEFRDVRDSFRRTQIYERLKMFNKSGENLEV